MLTIDSSSNHAHWAADVKTFPGGLCLVSFFWDQNIINYLKIAIKAGSSSGIILPPLRRLDPCIRCCNTFSLPGRQLHPASCQSLLCCCSVFPRTTGSVVLSFLHIILKPAGVLLCLFFMALLLGFLGQSTLVFFANAVFPTATLTATQQGGEFEKFSVKACIWWLLTAFSLFIWTWTSDMMRCISDSTEFKMITAIILCEEANRKLFFFLFQLSSYHLLPETWF